MNDCQKLFDIKGSSERIKVQENPWKAKMTASDHEFHNNQCLAPQIDYCSTDIDSKRRKNTEKKSL